MGWRTRRHTRKYLDGEYHKPKRKWFTGEFTSFVFYSIVSTLIFFIIYAMLFNPFFVKSTYENTKDFVAEKIEAVKSITPSDNSSSPTSQNKEINRLSKCKNQYNEYSKIGEQKYNIYYSLIKIQELYSGQEIQEFNDLYAGIFTPGIPLESIQVSPIIGLSIRRSSASMDLPIIVYCDHNGDMVEASKRTLTLSV